MELLESGERENGMAHLRQAVPGAPRARNVLGLQLFNDGQPQGAVEELQTFVRENPYMIEAVDAPQVLRRAYARQQLWQERSSSIGRC